MISDYVENRFRLIKQTGYIIVSNSYDLEYTSHKAFENLTSQDGIMSIKHQIYKACIVIMRILYNLGLKNC